jgi:hypothetical protein
MRELDKESLTLKTEYDRLEKQITDMNEEKIKIIKDF